MKKSLESAVKMAFKAIDDVAKTITYKSADTATPVYDPATGAYTLPTTDISVAEVVVTKYNEELIDNEFVQPQDQKVLIQQELLQNGGTPITPKVNDVITIDGEDWNIVRFEQDPADVIWKIQVRK